MKAPRQLHLIVLAVVALLLLGGLGAYWPGWVDAAPAQSTLGPSAIVADAISYQGYLTDDKGKPLTGTYTMTFQIYNADTGGTLLWDSGDISVDAADGLFAVKLEITTDIFNGEELWVAQTVDGQLLAPRQEILPAPMAHTLRPGAVIKGTASAIPNSYVLDVQMNNDLFSYDRGALFANTTTGNAVHGFTDNGSAVYGETADGYAIYGYDGGTDQTRGYAGYFYSENGMALYGRSNAQRTVQNMWAPGVYGSSSNGVGVLGETSSTMAAVLGKNSGEGPGGYFWSNNGVSLTASRATGSGNIVEVYGPNSFLGLLFRIDTSGNVRADGTYESPAADFAELLPARSGLEPGDVLVVGADGVLTRSSEAYQATVVGVYSTKPAFLGGAQEDGEQAGKVPLAVLGVVPVKVSAENGPIAPGDLLTTANLPGHAMRCTDVNLCFGRTIGKALEAAREGTDLIQALITLQ